MAASGVGGIPDPPKWGRDISIQVDQYKSQWLAAPIDKARTFIGGVLSGTSARRPDRPPNGAGTDAPFYAAGAFRRGGTLASTRLMWTLPYKDPMKTPSLTRMDWTNLKRGWNRYGGSDRSVLLCTPATWRDTVNFLVGDGGPSDGVCVMLRNSRTDAQPVGVCLRQGTIFAEKVHAAFDVQDALDSHQWTSMLEGMLPPAFVNGSRAPSTGIVMAMWVHCWMHGWTMDVGVDRAPVMYAFLKERSKREFAAEATVTRTIRPPPRAMPQVVSQGEADPTDAVAIVSAPDGAAASSPSKRVRRR